MILKLTKAFPLIQFFWDKRLKKTVTGAKDPFKKGSLKNYRKK